MSQRFSTDLNVDTVFASQYHDSTKKNDKYVMKLMKDFAEQMKFDYDSTSLNLWDNFLCEFYVSVRKLDGNEFQSNSPQCHTSCHYSTVKNYNTDIATNAVFSKSESVHKAMLRKLKKDGKGTVKHFDVIRVTFNFNFHN